MRAMSFAVVKHRAGPWLTFLLVALCCTPALAAPSFPLDDAFTTIQGFAGQMMTNVNTALQSAQVSQVVNLLFSVMALALFVWKFAGFALRGFDVLNILEVMLTIVFVFVLLTSYRAIFPAIFNAGLFVSDAIAFGIVGAPPGGTFSESLMTLFGNMTFNPTCGGLDCMGPRFLSIVATMLGWLSVILLGIIAVLVDLWVVWGFAIAYAIGWVTIPFLLYERLSFLFEGWLKFFFGISVYAIVAKANLALVYLSIQMFLGSSPTVTGSSPAPIEVDGFFDIIGLLVFVAVGIFSLLASGRFASAIVMAAGGGGVGGIVQAAAGAATNMASAGAGAIAGAMHR